MKRKIFGGFGFSFVNELFVLFYGVRDSRTPFYAKLVAAGAIIYLVSPVDLIPDFIPVAGLLDDLVIVPFLLHLAFSFLPPVVKDQSWAKARTHIVQLRLLLFALLLCAAALMIGLILLVKHLLQ